MRKVLAIIAMFLLLAGCASAPGDTASDCVTYDGVVLVVGVHANQPAPNVPADLACALRNTIAEGGTIGIVANDGEPSVLLSATSFDVTGNNDATTRNNITKAFNRVISTIQEAKPQKAGSDLFAALVLAADLAHTASPAIGKVISIDAGLPDRGEVNLTVPGGTLVAADQLAGYLTSVGALKDDTFANLDVEFWSLARVSEPQRPLAQAQVNNIAELWPALALAGGAKAATSVPMPREGDGVDTALETGLVEVIEPPEPVASSTMTFDDTSALGFASGDSTLLDRSAARAALVPVAEWLMAVPGRSAVITGRTDSDHPENNESLSTARGWTVAQLLGELGVKQEILTVVGAAYTAQPPDRLADGTLDPYAAALNRVTEIELVG